MIRKIRIHPRRPAESAVKEAAAELRRDRLVIFPTETLYGIAADPFSPRAVQRLLHAKKRGDEKGFILLIADPKDIANIAKRVTPAAKKLMRIFWPGPLTLVLPRKARIPRTITGGRATVAVRLTPHPVARELIAAFGGPITAPSANLSGKPSPRNAADAIRGLKHASYLPLALDAGPSKARQPSTIVDVTGKKPVILREGAISRKRIFEALK